MREHISNLTLKQVVHGVRMGSYLYASTSGRILSYTPKGKDTIYESPDRGTDCLRVICIDGEAIVERVTYLNNR